MYGENKRAKFMTTDSERLSDHIKKMDLYKNKTRPACSRYLYQLRRPVQQTPTCAWVVPEEEEQEDI